MTIRAKKEKIQYVCQSCGSISPRWMGKCGECQSWNSFVEEVATPVRRNAAVSTKKQSAPAVLSVISSDKTPRIQTKSTEFNRVLGGGIVPGSVVLIGGDPGIGKSTLMLQEAVAFATEQAPVIYATGEESLSQTKLRAQRLGIDSQHLYIHAETDVNNIITRAEELQPGLLIVDSIQTTYQPALESTPGTVSQVRECALSLANFAKENNLPVFLIGHVTKEGYLAGPKVLEHMVDVLLQFEGDRDQFYRILRSSKNRFGSTREIGVFEMTEKGLIEVKNPSKVFLEQRRKNIPGSAVICTLEGTRPFLVEIQALVSPTSYGMPQRTSTGVEAKRVSLLLAVLEKRIGLRLGAFDVFVNAAGGVRIEEPSADLGVLIAIASSFKDQVVAPDAVVIGEIGLGGEIRSVPQIEKRLDEAAKLGFKKAIVPELNLKGVSNSGSMKLVGVGKAEEAIEEVLI